LADIDFSDKRRAMALSSLLSFVCLAAISLHIVEKEIEVSGKEASCFCLEPFGLRFKAGEEFDVELSNNLFPSSIHWHYSSNKESEFSFFPSKEKKKASFP
jgi:hypothetical protein